MFRYYGIPARYVEGYLITTDAAKKMQPGKKRTIRSDEQHAWPEIYIDGVSWVPIKVCTKYLFIFYYLLFTIKGSRSE